MTTSVFTFIHVDNMSGTTSALGDDLTMICRCYIYGFPVEGIRCGTQCAAFPQVHHSDRGYLLVWSRADRSNYIIQQVDPAKPTSLSSILAGTTLTLSTSSFVLFYCFDQLDDQNDDTFKAPDYNLPDNSDADDHLRHLEKLDADMHTPSSSSGMDHSNRSSPDVTTDSDHSMRKSNHDISEDSDRDSIKAELLGQLKEKLNSFEEDHEVHDPSARSSGINNEPVFPIVDQDEDVSRHILTVSMESDLPEGTPQRSNTTTSSSPELISADESSVADTIPYDEAYLCEALSEEIHKSVVNNCEQNSSALPVFFNSSDGSSSVFQAMSGEVFRVESDTDNLSLNDLYNFDDDVFAADAAEVKQFVTHEVWQPVRLENHSNIIDSTWVRKWKYKNGTYQVKSRLCCRGCFDRQNSFLLKSASVASRLSQRILLSNAAINNWDTESWDVSSALLRGLTFAKVGQIAAELGVPSPLTEREVVVKLPGNVWFHLYKLGVLNERQYSEAKAGKLGVLLRKCMYGLKDAPLLWQLALRHYLIF